MNKIITKGNVCTFWNDELLKDLFKNPEKYKLTLEEEKRNAEYEEAMICDCNRSHNC